MSTDLKPAKKRNGCPITVAQALAATAVIVIGAVALYAYAPGAATASWKPAASAARLVFESYEPSKAEKEWGVYLRTHDVKQSLCPALIAPPFHGWISTWLNGTTEAKDYIIDVNAAPPDFLSMMKAIGLKDTEEVFSVLRFKDTCTGEVVSQYIEPLLGLMRDPRGICSNKGAKPWIYPKVVDADSTKDYILRDPTLFLKTRARITAAQAEGKAPPRVGQFDMGASIWGGRGFGIQWLIKSLKRLGLVPDMVFAWELEKMETSKFFEGMPLWLQNRTVFYNVGVDTVVGAPDNAVTLLKKHFSPEDFVVVKLDIDNTPIEEAVIKEIMTDSEAVARVDELMFEHHYYSIDCAAFWGLGMTTSILESFDLFTNLRKLGFVAHVWP